VGTNRQNPNSLPISFGGGLGWGSKRSRISVRTALCGGGGNRSTADRKHPRLPSFQFRSLVTFVALFTIELDAEPALPALGRRHPRTLLPRRLMAHVLRVSALKLGHPVGAIVPMKADDFCFIAGALGLRRQTGDALSSRFPARAKLIRKIWIAAFFCQKQPKAPNRAEAKPPKKRNRKTQLPRKSSSLLPTQM
jgi:hypothetical protein